MKVEELRPGNLLQKTDNPIWLPEFIGEVTVVDINVFKMIHDNLDQTFLSPIPLTEEWLENKFSFEIQESPKDTVIWMLNGFMVVNRWLSGEWGNFFILVGGKEVEIKYVHTIQNAYALTGNELTT